MPRQSTATRSHNKIDDAMRERLINAVFMEGLNVNETAKRYQYPVSSVRTIINNFEQTGRIASLKRGGNRHRVPEPEHIAWMSARLDEEPDLTAEELQRRLVAHFQLNPPISKSAVYKAMAEKMSPGFRFTPVPSASALIDDYNTPDRIAARQLWANQFVDENSTSQQQPVLGDCVFVAEAGFNLHMWRRRVPRSEAAPSAVAAAAGLETADARRQRGRRAGAEASDTADSDGGNDRGAGGENAEDIPASQRVRNTTMVVALDKNGVIASDLRLGAFDTAGDLDDFMEQFLLQKLLPKINRTTRRLIVMDQVRFITRGGAAVTDGCRRGGGHKIVFLPKDSGVFLNAAEFCLANARSHIPKSDIRRETLNGNVHASLAEIARESVQEWMDIVENNFELALQGEGLTDGSHLHGNNAAVSTEAARAGGADTNDNQPHQADAAPANGRDDIDYDY